MGDDLYMIPEITSRVDSSIFVHFNVLKYALFCMLFIANRNAFNFSRPAGGHLHICTILDSYNPNYEKQIAVQFVSYELLLQCMNFMNFKIVGLKA